MLDRKVQAVVAAAAVGVVDVAVQAGEGRAAEVRAEEVRVEEDLAEAAAVLTVVLAEEEAGEVVEEADVAEVVEAEEAEASGSVYTICLFPPYASMATKESSCEHHCVDLLCSLAIITLTCLIHVLQYRGAHSSVLMNDLPTWSGFSYLIDLTDKLPA